MESARRWNSKVSDKKINEMIKYRKEGKTYDQIAELVGFDYSTVYRYTRHICKEEEKPKTPKYEKVIALLEEGKTVLEIYRETGISEDYIRKIRKTKKYKEYKPVKKTDRQIEVEKICKEVNRQKEKQKKEWEEHRKIEIEELKKRFNIQIRGKHEIQIY